MNPFSFFSRRKDTAMAVKVLTVATVVGLLIHSSWVPLFAILKIPELAVLDLIAIPVYVFALIVLRRSRFILWGWILTAEILTNITVTTVFVGWDAGFHYFAFIVAFGAFAIPGLRNWDRWSAFGCAAVVYCLLYLICGERSPLSSVPDQVGLQIANIVLLFISIGVLFSSFNASVRRTVRELNTTNLHLERIAGTDALTGLANRRTMYEALDKAMRNFVSAQKPFSLVIADIDGFKNFNDRHGHACGDHVLVECAAFMKNSFRSVDTVARWGGEEFLILLPDTELAEAQTVAERVRNEISHHTIDFGEKRLCVTFTFGVCQSHAGLRDIAQLIKQADEAMMTGKRQGKNRTIVVNVP